MFFVLLVVTTVKQYKVTTFLGFCELYSLFEALLTTCMPMSIRLSPVSVLDVNTLDIN